MTYFWTYLGPFLYKNPKKCNTFGNCNTLGPCTVVENYNFRLKVQFTATITILTVKQRDKANVRTLRFSRLLFFQMYFSFVSMVSFYSSEAPQYLRDYGCVGRGYFNSSEPVEGMPKDEVDSAFVWWKKCIHCGKLEYNQLNFQYNADEHNEFYDFDEVDDQLCRKIFIFLTKNF